MALRDIPLGPVSAEFTVWGRNLTENKDVQFPFVVPFTAAASYQQARTIGADLIVKF